MADTSSQTRKRGGGGGAYAVQTQGPGEMAYIVICSNYNLRTNEDFEKRTWPSKPQFNILKS